MIVLQCLFRCRVSSKKVVNTNFKVVGLAIPRIEVKLTTSKAQNQRIRSLPFSKPYKYFFLVNCWPNEDGDGGCDVNIEYELQAEDLELIDVTISIPVPSGVGAPNVADLDGEFKHDSRKNIIDW